MKQLLACQDSLILLTDESSLDFFWHVVLRRVWAGWTHEATRLENYVFTRGTARTVESAFLDSWVCRGVTVSDSHITQRLKRNTAQESAPIVGSSALPGISMSRL